MTITVRVDNIEIIYQQETHATDFPMIATQDYKDAVIKAIAEMVEQVIKISKEKL